MALSSNNDDTANIYVLLTDEPVPMWRPVKARQLKENTYQILSDQTVDEDEEWEFQPGDIVFVEEKLDFRGEVYLAAVKKVVV
jgi:hypothetical protein